MYKWLVISRAGSEEKLNIPKQHAKKRGFAEEFCHFFRCKSQWSCHCTKSHSYSNVNKRQAPSAQAALRAYLLAQPNQRRYKVSEAKAKQAKAASLLPYAPFFTRQTHSHSHALSTAPICEPYKSRNTPYSHYCYSTTSCYVPTPHPYLPPSTPMPNLGIQSLSA